jgi:hypothetical protein
MSVKSNGCERILSERANLYLGGVIPLGTPQFEEFLLFHHCFRHCHSFMQMFYWDYLGIMRERD